jgi:hypothetical protein
MKKATFMEKLRAILDDETISFLIHWTEFGKTFVVEDLEEFSRIILPMHFKHSNFSSFVRQLHGYGFHKKQLSNGNVEFSRLEKLNDEDMLNVQRRYNAAPSTASKSLVSSEPAAPLSITELQSEMNELKEQYQSLINDNRALMEANLKLREQLDAMSTSSNPATPTSDTIFYNKAPFTNADSEMDFKVEDFLLDGGDFSSSILPVDKKPDFAYWQNPMEVESADLSADFVSLQGFQPFEYSSYNGYVNSFVDNLTGFF